MKLSEIIAVADRAYPDGLVQAHYENPDGQHGDTLAEFIALELRDTYDADASDEDQWSEAARVVRRARDELDKVLSALEAEIG